MARRPILMDWQVLTYSPLFWSNWLDKIVGYLFETWLQSQLDGDNLQGWSRFSRRPCIFRIIVQYIVYSPTSRIHRFKIKGCKREWHHSVLSPVTHKQNFCLLLLWYYILRPRFLNSKGGIFLPGDTMILLSCKLKLPCGHFECFML